MYEVGEERVREKGVCTDKDRSMRISRRRTRSGVSPRVRGRGKEDSCNSKKSFSVSLRLEVETFVCSAMHSPLFLVFFSVIERTVRVAFVRIERAADLRACRSTDGQEYLGSEASC